MNNDAPGKAPSNMPQGFVSSFLLLPNFSGDLLKQVHDGIRIQKDLDRLEQLGWIQQAEIYQKQLLGLALASRQPTQQE